MKSTFGSRFCHDLDAAGYDMDVRNERHPVRSGYAEAQRWIGSQVPEDASVLDLGAGTGNTILALPLSCSVTAVDISTTMLQIAAQKVAGRPVRFVLSDILEYFDRPGEPFDAVVSGYAIHHLTDEEKHGLFGSIRARLKPGGRAVFVDLMFKNKLDREMLMNRYSGSHPDVVADIREEFFWNLEKTEQRLSADGFTVSSKRFSDLSWGVLAERGPTG